MNYNVTEGTPRGIVMGKSDNSTGIVELWGHEFKKAKHGLDEEQVVSFVNKLMEEHETLLKRAEHLSSLTQLAEKTIVEADDLAKKVEKEAGERAKAEANAIIAKAEEQAQKLIQEKTAEAVAMANREAEAIKAKAEQRAEALLEEKVKSIQPELKDSAKRLYEELLTQLESLKQQTVTLAEDLDRKLSQPLAETSPPEKVSTEADKAGNEFLELIQPADETSEGEADWELEILPPVDLTQILDIINHLDSLAEVEKTELIPQIDKPLIMVFLSEPIDLIDILTALPQVAQVTEEATDSADAEGKTKKAQIGLTENPVPQQSN
jgi:cell division septum initiation protein DivIVA